MTWATTSIWGLVILPVSYSFQASDCAMFNFAPPALGNPNRFNLRPLQASLSPLSRWARLIRSLGSLICSPEIGCLRKSYCLMSRKTLTKLGSRAASKHVLITSYLSSWRQQTNWHKLSLAADWQTIGTVNRTRSMQANSVWLGKPKLKPLD